jgi:hypothetical protein
MHYRGYLLLLFYSAFAQIWETNGSAEDKRSKKPLSFLENHLFQIKRASPILH